MAVIIWSLLALALAGLVVFSNQLEFLVPAAAAFVVALVSMIPGVGNLYLLQTAVWLALSAAGLAVFWRKLRALKRPKGGPAQESVAGKTAVVTEALTDTAPGRVRFQGTTWVASSAEAVPVGAAVEILGQDGLTLSVRQRTDDRIQREFQALEHPNKENS
jgi:membrane protein implicated in regulation of membrane protease activity